MSIESRNGLVTPGSIAAKCCSDCAADAAHRDAMLRHLHLRIANLFTSEELFSHEIAEILVEDSSLNSSVSITTRASFVRKVIAEIVDKETAKIIRSKQRAEMLDGHRSEINAGRNSYMLKAGMFVWEPDETEVLNRMMHNERYLLPIDRATKKRGTRTRARHCNIQLILETLKYVYPEREFTRDIVISKVEYVRSVERKKKNAVTASDQQSPQVPQAD